MRARHAILAALLAAAACDFPLGPDKGNDALVFVGEQPATTFLIARPAGPPSSAPLATFEQVEVKVNGYETFDLKFTNASGCAVTLLMPYKPGIYAIDAGATPSVPPYGTVSCSALGGTRPLRGELVVVTAAVDHEPGGAAVAEFMSNGLAWEGSGGAHFAGTVGFAAKSPPPPPPKGSDTSSTTIVECPNVDASQYNCVEVGGKTAPLKYKLPVGPTGGWYNQGLGACITYNANGTSNFKMDAGVFGGATSYSSKWGALVDKRGQVTTANGNIIYIYTGAQDAQIKLLNFNTSTRQWVQPGWVQRGC